MKKILIYLSFILFSVLGILYTDSKLYFYGSGHNYYFNKTLPYELVPFYSGSDLGFGGLIFQDKYGFYQIGKEHNNFTEFKEYDVKQYYFNERCLLIKIQKKENDIKFIEIIPKQKDNYSYFSYNKLTASDFHEKIKKLQLEEVSFTDDRHIISLKQMYFLSWCALIITIILFIKVIIKMIR